MAPFNMGEGQHPSIRPNGRGGGLVRMDGERDCVAAAWAGASKLEGSAAALIFQSDTGGPPSSSAGPCCHREMMIASLAQYVLQLQLKKNNGSSHTLIDALWAF